ncbi:MAG TPA: hypothetical protein VGB44_05125 [Flavobacterium sp.]|jgi:hypothetical protein
MEVIKDRASLKHQIALLELKQQEEKQAISDEVSHFIDDLKPKNMFSHLVGSVKGSPDLQADLLRGVVGLGTGFLTNQVLLSSFHGPFKRLVATAIQAGITSFAVKYPDTIKEKSIGFITNLLQSLKFKSDPDIDQQQFEGQSYQ